MAIPENVWIELVPHGVNYAGYIPSFISPHDKRPLREQLDSAYRHGGGYRPQQGWTFYPRSGAMQYPGDPRLLPSCLCKIRDETVIVYPHDYVAVVQKDDSFVMARMS